VLRAPVSKMTYTVSSGTLNPSIPYHTEWEMYITAQGSRLRNDLYCVEWDVKLSYTIPYLDTVGLVTVIV